MPGLTNDGLSILLRTLAAVASLQDSTTLIGRTYQDGSQAHRRGHSSGDDRFRHSMMGASMAKTQTAEQKIAGLAQGDPKVLETLTQMTLGTLERSGLDEQTYMLVRMAALVASDAAPVSYLANLGVAAEAGVTLDQVVGTMVAVAPVVGAARITSAASKMTRAGILGAKLGEMADEVE